MARIHTVVIQGERLLARAASTYALRASANKSRRPGMTKK
jgi:hypothetical protein